jgi:anaerobic glycerol-3-phosphate dehydrogenase
MDCSTEERMVTNVIQEWFHDSGVRNIWSKLVESMPKRVQEVILAKGKTFLNKLCERIVFEGLE